MRLSLELVQTVLQTHTCCEVLNCLGHAPYCQAYLAEFGIIWFLVIVVLMHLAYRCLKLFEASLQHIVSLVLHAGFDLQS